MFIKMKVPERLFNNPIEDVSPELKFVGPLRRNRITTVGQLIDCINDGLIPKLPGVGKGKTQLIYNCLFNYVIEHMTDKQVQKFVWDYVRR